MSSLGPRSWIYSDTAVQTLKACIKVAISITRLSMCIQTPPFHQPSAQPRMLPMWVFDLNLLVLVFGMATHDPSCSCQMLHPHASIHNSLHNRPSCTSDPERDVTYLPPQSNSTSDSTRRAPPMSDCPQRILSLFSLPAASHLTKSSSH